MSFQKTVNQQLTPAVAGDFCGANAHMSAVAGPDHLVTGAGGANIGLFAWADANGLVTNAGSGVPTGFIHRDQQGLITAWLGGSSMNIPVGLPVTVMTKGDFYAKTLTAATPGQKVFASNTDGTVKTGAAGATIAGYTETSWAVPAGFSCNANELVKITSWS